MTTTFSRNALYDFIHNVGKIYILLKIYTYKCLVSLQLFSVECTAAWVVTSTHFYFHSDHQGDMGQGHGRGQGHGGAIGRNNYTCLEF